MQSFVSLQASADAQTDRLLLLAGRFPEVRTGGELAEDRPTWSVSAMGGRALTRIPPVREGVDCRLRLVLELESHVGVADQVVADVFRNHHFLNLAVLCELAEDVLRRLQQRVGIAHLVKLVEATLELAAVFRLCDYLTHSVVCPDAV